tara:strand:- start:2584 stop:2952 length:369 start_codon:yes stop_codon:yes gene_type:complete
MAEVCGVSREAIRKYEKGLLLPSNQTLKQMFDSLGVTPEESNEARRILISVYQARRARSGGDIRSFGPAAQAEIESMTSSDDRIDEKADALVEVFYNQLGTERKSESFTYFLKNQILGILRS